MIQEGKKGNGDSFMYDRVVNSDSEDEREKRFHVRYYLGDVMVHDALTINLKRSVFASGDTAKL